MEHLSLGEFNIQAEELAKTLSPHESGATILALHGDLGAGKTTFVQQIARTLGISEHVISPTFVIQKQYPLIGQKFSQLVHIDAYRLDTAQQLEALGWEDMQKKTENLILIEWPEKVADILPKSTQHVYFEHLDENSRSISYEKKEQ